MAAPRSRDRSLVTISALIANGQVAQLTGHIPIGMNNGLTQPEIAEANGPRGPQACFTQAEPRQGAAVECSNCS